MKKYGPVCPNHGCPLDGIGFPMPKKGTGICQISGVPFDYVIEVDEDDTQMKVDKFGNKIKGEKITVTGND